MSTDVELEAGPALDAEIARRVFGKQPCDQWHLWHAAMGSWTTNDGHDAQAHNCYPSQCPVQYSQLIQAAWLVVEKMREQGVSIMITSPFTTEDRWVVEVWIKDDDDDVTNLGEVAADTAPLAICRAAWVAIERSEA
jgi:hypothetical protein